MTNALGGAAAGGEEAFHLLSNLVLAPLPPPPFALRPLPSPTCPSGADGFSRLPPMCVSAQLRAAPRKGRSLWRTSPCPTRRTSSSGS